jgi:molybdate transport system substrate-binding protein
MSHVRAGAAFLLVFLFGPVQAQELVRVAVASNFLDTAAVLGTTFQHDTGTEVRLSAGSTGKLYAQIINGAPFDVFLAADIERPALLEQSGHAVAGSGRIYARGRLVVWSASAKDCLAALHEDASGKVAIANPVTAPYGRAAREFLQDIGAWERVAQRIVYGQNAVQALQFAATGNAAVAIVARSQVSSPALPPAACRYEVPEAQHAPIAQQAVLINAESDAARRFLDFLESDEARHIIERSGYEVGR